MSVSNWTAQTRRRGMQHLEAAIDNAPVVTVGGRDGGYRFKVFDFGERGTRLSSELLHEIGHGLRIVASGNFADLDAIVTPEPGGHVWGVLLAFQLGLTCHVLRSPAPQIPSQADTFSRNTAYSRGELLVPSIGAGARVLIVDDVISSGSTMAAIIELLRALRVEIAGLLVIATKGTGYLELEQRTGIPVTSLWSAVG